MKMKNKLELRMYSLVNYQLSGTIHAGIQPLHSVVEYAQKYFNTKEYQDWAKNWKTVIILSGGPTNNDGHIGIQKNLELLKKNKIKHSVFHEPDLNNALTSISFLVDERVFSKGVYKNYIELKNLTKHENTIEHNKWVKSIGGKQNEFLREFLKDKKLA